MVSARALGIRKALQRALLTDDTTTANTLALQLAEELPNACFVQKAIGAVMLHCGDYRRALRWLSPDAHALRARAHAGLGEQDLARAEDCLATYHADPARGYSTVSEAYDLLRPIAWAGELFRVGEWDESQSILRAMYDDFSPPTVGARYLHRLDGSQCPRWDGRPVDHLLAIGVDGNGDFLQFARYVNPAAERCKRITVTCRSSLHRCIRGKILPVDDRDISAGVSEAASLYSLALRCLPVEKVLDALDLRAALQEADAYSTISMLLADQLGMHYASPWTLMPKAGAVARLGVGRHIGLCWAASAKERTIAFENLAPLRLLPGASFHSLQVGAAADDADPWVTRHNLRTYEDTLSLVCALDAVVTVDTSVAHVAGNAGIPCHLIVSKYADGRWQTGQTTRWYPKMRIYRGEIGPAIDAVLEALAGRAGDGDTVANSRKN